MYNMTYQNPFEMYTSAGFPTQDMPHLTMIDDWLSAPDIFHEMKPKMVPIAPRPADLSMQFQKGKIPLDRDDLAIKRKKNTDAARRSRLKKMIKIDKLESKVADLESENRTLSTRVAVLESEKTNLKSKDNSQEERIRVLEQHLAEVHKALTTQAQKL